MPVHVVSTKHSKIFNRKENILGLQKEYRKTPNKRPWAFASFTASKRAILPFSSFLQNRAKNVKKDPFWGLGGRGGVFIGRGHLLGVLQYEIVPLRLIQNVLPY